MVGEVEGGHLGDCAVNAALDTLEQKHHSRAKVVSFLARLLADMEKLELNPERAPTGFLRVVSLYRRLLDSVRVGCVVVYIFL